MLGVKRGLIDSEMLSKQIRVAGQVVDAAVGVVKDDEVPAWSGQCLLRSVSVSIVSMSSPLIRGRLVASSLGRAGRGGLAARRAGP